MSICITFVPKFFSIEFLLYGRNIHEGSALILTLVAQFLNTQWKTGHFGTLYIHPAQK